MPDFLVPLQIEKTATLTDALTSAFENPLRIDNDIKMHLLTKVQMEEAEKEELKTRVLQQETEMKDLK